MTGVAAWPDDTPGPDYDGFNHERGFESGSSLNHSRGRTGPHLPIGGTVADYFVYVMMALNASAGAAYLYAGNPWKAVYWCAAFTLNLCVVNMR